MASSRALTGGTGDVNPQYMSVKLTAPDVAGTVVESTVPLPINRVQPGGRANTAQVIEVLKVYYEYNYSQFFTNIDNTDKNVSGIWQGEIGVKTSTAMKGSVPDVISHDAFSVKMHQLGGTSANNCVAWTQHTPSWHDLTDGAGHGMLIPSDQLYFRFNYLQSGATTTTNLPFASIRMFYRIKNVSLQEYIGMVSQFSN